MKRLVILLIITFLFTGKQFVQGQSWEKVWSEEFETDTLDVETWEYQFGTGASEGLVGWGNNELQYYTDREENIFIEDDKLHIIAKAENFSGQDFTSARIRTKDMQDFKYGRFEISAKLPEGQGIWPAIWMMPTESVFGSWPASGEIDIMELVGHEPDVVHGTVHYGTNQPYDHQFSGGAYTLDEGKFSDDFHEFAIEWSPEQIRWYVDDEFYYMVTPDHVEPSYNWPFDEYFHFILNVAVGGNWPGNPDSSTEFPQSMIVDYIHVYEDEELTSAEAESEVPGEVKLQQNYPNPFNPDTNIEFQIPENQHATLNVYNMLGQQVATLADGDFSAGTHTVTFNSGDLSSGTYIYRLESDGKSVSKQMTLIR